MSNEKEKIKRPHRTSGKADEYYSLSSKGVAILSGKFSGRGLLKNVIYCRNHPKVLAEYVDLDKPKDGPGTLCTRCKYGRGDL